MKNLFGPGQRITTTIPTENGLRDHLANLPTGLAEHKWERAAIVYAYTEEGAPRNSRYIPPPRMNIRQFADKGFAGLTTQKSVQRYRRAWVLAITRGIAVTAKPGGVVTLPDEDFPPWYDDTGSGPGFHRKERAMPFPRIPEYVVPEGEKTVRIKFPSGQTYRLRERGDGLIRFAIEGQSAEIIDFYGRSKEGADAIVGMRVIHKDETLD